MIRLRFFTAIIKVPSIEQSYKGGLAAFDAEFGSDDLDPDLRSISAMSEDDLERKVERLENVGIMLRRDIAIGDMMHGEIIACPGIEFSDVGDSIMPTWSTRAIPQTP